MNICLDDIFDGIHTGISPMLSLVCLNATEMFKQILGEIITREEGVALVERNDREVPKRDLAFFLDYTRIEEEYFQDVINIYIEECQMPAKKLMVNG